MNSSFYSNLLIGGLVALFSAFFLSKRLRNSKDWKATVTPLASIIGSGFLISAPLLVLTAGKWAPLVIVTIVFIAYFLGGVMRFNIINFEPLLEGRASRNRFILKLEAISRPTLGIAYIISVTFYLQLFSAFLFRGFNVSNPLFENISTTFMLIFIGVLGWRRGFSMLEVLEMAAVNLKLVIIFSMIVAHLVFNTNLIIDHQWELAKHSHYTTVEAFQRILGMLIIVQGFETSRYMGQEYSTETRVKTMRYSQLISGIIYVLFVSSAMVLFNNLHQVSEVSVIALCGMIAPILPFLLIIAALVSQFSAAVADTLGSSGLLSEATGKRISVKNGILIIALVAIVLTWTTNIYEIITLASRAFAAYYALQCLIAVIISFRMKAFSLLKLYRVGSYLSLLILMLLVIFFSQSVE